MKLLIESGIEPLVSALNDIECIRTVYSCEGHFNRPVNEKFLPTAYVTFGVNDIERFLRLYDRILAQSRRESDVDYRLTYDCVLGRYTLSIWSEAGRREPALKRAVVDEAIVRLSKAIRDGAERPSASPQGDVDSRRGGSPHPCRESGPPCVLVIPPKNPACPFTGPDATGNRGA